MGWGPSAPDTSAADAAAAKSAAISEQQFDYYKTNIAPLAKTQMEDNIKYAKLASDRAEEGQKFQMDTAKRYDDRFWNVQAPMQDRLVKDAANFDTEGRREEMAGVAMADVENQIGAADEAAQRGLQRRGVNPNSAAALSMSNAVSLNRATARANAGNQVRTAARAEGYGRRVDAQAMLQGLSGFSSAATAGAQNYMDVGLRAGTSGMAGISAAGNLGNSTANYAAGNLNASSGQMRANAIERAKDPTFDFFAGLAVGGVKTFAPLIGEGIRAGANAIGGMFGSAKS